MQEMTRLKFRFMDLLLLTSPPEDPWRLRSKLAIEAAIKDQIGLRITLSERDLDQIVKPGWIKIEKNAEDNVFIAPTRTGVAEHFAKYYRVGHFLERDRPFAGGILDALAHWFDAHFSPKSHMNARLEETGIPGACLGSGTKWREAAWLFEQWNQPVRYSYISAFLVYLLDQEQWSGAEDVRARAWSEVEEIFRPAGLRLHEIAYLVPALEQEQAQPKLGAWGDEFRFRQELVEPMLRQVPGIIHVICTHGNDEYGRDFIFDYRHPLLGDRRWVAVQVKVGNVSGTAGGILRTILDQVQMAFEHPITDLGAMGKVSTSEVIVLISGHFTNNAKERILDSMRDPVWRANTFFMDKTGIEGILRTLPKENVV